MVLFILGGLLVAMSTWKGFVEPQSDAAWIHQVSICSVGFVWILAAMFWHRARWRLAAAFTLLGFVVLYVIIPYVVVPYVFLR